jgi:hypothetical protein
VLQTEEKEGRIVKEISKDEFKALGYERLHRKLLSMMKQAQRMMLWFNAAERTNLLPALMAMKELTAQPGRREPDPNRPNWEEECALIGISPDTIRQWKVRTAAEADIKTLVGEEKTAGGKSDGPTVSQLKRQLALLSQAVITQDDERAEKLATAFAEIYGF